MEQKSYFRIGFIFALVWFFGSELFVLLSCLGHTEISLVFAAISIISLFVSGAFMRLDTKYNKAADDINVFISQRTVTLSIVCLLVLATQIALFKVSIGFDTDGKAGFLLSITSFLGILTSGIAFIVFSIKAIINAVNTKKGKRKESESEVHNHFDSTPNDFTSLYADVQKSIGIRSTSDTRINKKDDSGVILKATSSQDRYQMNLGNSEPVPAIQTPSNVANNWESTKSDSSTVAKNNVNDTLQDDESDLIIQETIIKAALKIIKTFDSPVQFKDKDFLNNILYYSKSYTHKSISDESQITDCAYFVLLNACTKTINTRIYNTIEKETWDTISVAPTKFYVVLSENCIRSMAHKGIIDQIRQNELLQEVAKTKNVVSICDRKFS